jgi:hypothetical protein
VIVDVPECGPQEERHDVAAETDSAGGHHDIERSDSVVEVLAMASQALPVSR